MSTTTYFEGSATLTFNGHPRVREHDDELVKRYGLLISEQRHSWTEHHHLNKLLGSGGQGIVYLSERRGTDQFTLPVALKVFSPQYYEDARSYDEAMGRIAHIAARVAQIQQDNLIDVHNFIDRHRIRIMEMEWVDGYDLSRLLSPGMLERAKNRVSNRRWEYINNVIVTAGPVQPRLKPGIAIAVLRECLAALAALHREGIVHGDIKPSNIMLKRTGNAKIIDIGSAFEIEDAPTRRSCTPTYSAPEVLEGVGTSPRSDLCSLGYVLIEMLAGAPTFPGQLTYKDLLEAKRAIVHRLHDWLPDEVVRSEHLMNLIRSLIAPDPQCRFPSAEAADMGEKGSAASFHRQLVKGDLATEYENDIRLWLEELD
ncbi:MAG TPA: serine/threonine-protein kinase [Pirellulales bacterium]|nr:serine/threonine-protein kinase [Pirellulales bacterium]